MPGSEGITVCVHTYFDGLILCNCTSVMLPHEMNHFNGMIRKLANVPTIAVHEEPWRGLRLSRKSSHRWG